MRLWLTVGILLGVVVAGGSAIWWMFLGSLGERQWQAMEHRLQAQGYTLKYRQMERSGFPFELVWTADGIELSHPGSAGSALPLSGEVERLSITSRPWAPQRMTFRIEGQHHWAVDTRGAAGVIDIAVGTTEGSVGPRAEASGWRLQAALRQITASPRADAASAMTIATADVTAETPLRLETLAVDAVLSQIGLPQDFGLGRTVETLRLRGEMQPLPYDTSATGLTAWQAAGGQLTLSEVALRFGPVDAVADGKLGLDAALRLQGKVGVRMRRPNEVLALATAQNWITAKQQPLYAMAIALFSRSNGAGEPEAMLQVDFSKGGVWLGPIRLTDLPPVASAR